MTVIPDACAPHVVVDGVVDDSNCRDLEATLDVLMRKDHAHVVVDLGRVKVMDSTAARMLVHAQETQRGRRRDLRIGSVSDTVRQLFNVLQLGYMLPSGPELRDKRQIASRQESRRRIRALFDPVV